MWVTSSLANVLTPTAIALGNFDGVHRGHRRVIEPVLTSLDWVEGKRLLPTVVTFSPHPQEFFTGERRPLLMPLSEKAAELQQLGVEQLVMLPFDQPLACLTPQEFVETILVKQLQAWRVSVGANFRFGRQRSGTTQDLQTIAASYGIEVIIASLEREGSERISSSAIRQALGAGNLQMANEFLGRPYSLVGQVVKGNQLGRTIGFPTANLQLPAEKFLPRFGVYAVHVRIYSANPDEKTAMPPPLPAVMNLGYRPTIAGTKPTVEVHLLDWVGDLYGQVLVVELEAFLRPEQKFPSLDALKQQIQADCAVARSLLQKHRPVEGEMRL